MRKKNVAGIYALLLGTLGLHRFYLGQRGLGFLYFVATMFCIVLSMENEAPIILIPALVTLVDAFLFFGMPKELFDKKFNREFLQDEPQQTMRGERRQRRENRRVSPEKMLKATAIEKYRQFDYEGAIEDLKKSLSEKYDDPATHFNLACCYSLLEKTGPSLFHLGKAVQFGFVDFDKIEQHPGLAFLRTQAEFREFVKNGYRHNGALPPPEEDLLSQTPPQKEDTLLAQINRLSELRNKGMLTEEEFLVQTKRVLGN
jgi:hypothetical protein